MGRGRARFRTGYLSSASFSLRNFSRVFSFSVKSYGLTTGRQGFSGGVGLGEVRTISSWSPLEWRSAPPRRTRPPGAVWGGVRGDLPACHRPAHSYSIVSVHCAPKTLTGGGLPTR